MAPKSLWNMPHRHWIAIVTNTLCKDVLSSYCQSVCVSVFCSKNLGDQNNTCCMRVTLATTSFKENWIQTVPAYRLVSYMCLSVTLFVYLSVSDVAEHFVLFTCTCLSISVYVSVCMFVCILWHFVLVCVTGCVRSEWFGGWQNQFTDPAWFHREPATFTGIRHVANKEWYNK